MKNNILCEQSTSTEDYAKSLESILPNATVKSKENSDRFYSFGEGIFSNGFYLGRTTTQNFFQMEIQNSHSIIVSIPIIGQYATKFSSKTFKQNTPKRGSIFLPTDTIQYTTDIDIIEDLVLIFDYEQLAPLLEQKYGISNNLEHCIDFDIRNPKIQLHYEVMMDNLKILRLYPHLTDSFHYITSIKEVAKLLLAELIADSLNVKPKLNNKTDSIIVNKAEELIDANPEKFFRIQQIADSTSTTPRNLQLAFRKYRNYTPMQFLRERKLHKARLLLRNPDSYTMIKQIAYESGFLNLSSFSKLYKELFGESPSETLQNTTRL